MARIQQSGQAVADANGVATVTIAGPSAVSTVWRITSVVVQSTNATRIDCRVYRNFIATTQAIAFSRDGRSDTAEVNDTDELRSGQQLIFQWIGCTPGATCTATVEVEPR